MYTYTIHDFVNIKENNAPFPIEDMVRVCKRKNNKARDFLFVNKYQGKHFPTQYEEFSKMISALSERLLQHCNKGERILLIGMAETATAIAMQIGFDILADGKCPLVHYVQTTREYLPIAREKISFQEEHSHAVEQVLYLHPWNKFDTVVMVDDEITTGKTIRNMVRCIREKFKAKRYIAASILNFQNKMDEEQFREDNIESVYLVRGEIKENIPMLHVEKEVEPENYTEETDIAYITLLFGESNPRCGMTGREMQTYLKNIQTIVEQYKDEILDGNTLVLGTEEMMFPAIFFTSKIKNSVTQSTTRSPICIAKDDGYFMNNGLKMNSSYGSDREVYLYDIPENKYHRLCVITDTYTEQFEAQIRNVAKKKGIQDVRFIKVS